MSKSEVREHAAGYLNPDNDDRLAVIRRLNDNLRMNGLGGTTVFTAGVQALPEPILQSVLRAFTQDADFCESNDPRGEHDFGVIEIGEHRLFWKIDYFDESFRFHSSDPSDSSKTERVLTLMLDFEY